MASRASHSMTTLAGPFSPGASRAVIERSRKARIVCTFVRRCSVTSRHVEFATARSKRERQAGSDRRSGGRLLHRRRIQMREVDRRPRPRPPRRGCRARPGRRMSPGPRLRVQRSRRIAAPCPGPGQRTSSISQAKPFDSSRAIARFSCRSAMLPERFETPATPCNLSSGPRVICTYGRRRRRGDHRLELAAALGIETRGRHRQLERHSEGSKIAAPGRLQERERRRHGVERSTGQIAARPVRQPSWPVASAAFEARDRSSPRCRCRSSESRGA